MSESTREPQSWLVVFTNGDIKPYIAKPPNSTRIKRYLPLYIDPSGEIERLRGSVYKLFGKTIDGTLIVVDMDLWDGNLEHLVVTDVSYNSMAYVENGSYWQQERMHDGVVGCMVFARTPEFHEPERAERICWWKCYSTPEAAQAAKENSDG